MPYRYARTTTTACFPGRRVPRDLRAYVEDPAWFFCPSDDVSRPFLRRSRGELLTATSYTYRSPQGSVDAQPEVASFALMWIPTVASPPVRT